jgi:hypothetical protein
MRTVFSILLGLAVFASTSAQATPFKGTLRVEIGALGGLNFPGTGDVINTATQLTLPYGVFDGTYTVGSIPAPPITKIKLFVKGNGVADFMGTPLGGTMPVVGGASIYGNLGMGPVLLIGVPFTRMSAMGAITAGIGVGGMYTVPASQAFVIKQFTWTDWSEGMKTVMGLTYQYHFATGMLASMTTTPTTGGTMGSTFKNATDMRSGSDTRTPGGAGFITLVSPTKVVLAISPFQLVVWSTLIVPEPAAPLALLTGALVLAEAGRRKLRRR